jgi:hypothetical protein
LLDALEVALLEAQVRQRRHVLLPRHRIEDTDGDLILGDVGVGVQVGMSIEGNGLLLGCSCRRVQVVSRGRMALDGRALQRRRNLARDVRLHRVAVSRYRQWRGGTGKVRLESECTVLAVDVGGPANCDVAGKTLAARITKLTHGQTTPRRCSAIPRHTTHSYPYQAANMGNQPSAILDNIASGSNCA